MVWLSQKPDTLRVSIKAYTATDTGNQGMSAFLMTLRHTMNIREGNVQLMVDD